MRGVYDRCIPYPNLYLSGVADVGVGKGAFTRRGEIVKPIDHELHDISKRQMKDYKETMASFARSKGEDRQRHEEPPMRMLIIPANSGASSFLNILNDNEGRGLLLETKGYAQSDVALLLRKLLRCAPQGIPSRAGEPKPT